MNFARSPSRFNYANMERPRCSGHRPSQKQDVSNPGQRRARDDEASELRMQLQMLSQKVADLEARLSASTVQAAPAAAPAGAVMNGAVHEAAPAAPPPLPLLSSSLSLLDQGVVGERRRRTDPAPRPSTAPYRTTGETGSLASWSADAFGKSKTPGWYHTHRKELLAHRQRLAASEPKGCYVSHTKYADEAARISNTGRLAF